MDLYTDVGCPLCLQFNTFSFCNSFSGFSMNELMILQISLKYNNNLWPVCRWACKLRGNSSRIGCRHIDRYSANILINLLSFPNFVLSTGPPLPRLFPLLSPLPISACLPSSSHYQFSFYTYGICIYLQFEVFHVKLVLIHSYEPTLLFVMHFPH